jgi:hypothetical protein
MKTDFECGSSKFGLTLGEFSDLDKEKKKKLIRLIARIMERAYRRGVQQTLVLAEKDAIDEWIFENTHNYRYGKSLDVSIGLDGFTTSSVERLMMEENLENIGLN